MDHPPRSPQTIAMLGVTQLVSWGSLYYAFAILSQSIARDTGMRPEIVFGAYSWALLACGLAAPVVGRLIDRHGGRPVLAGGSVVTAAGFFLLAHASGVFLYFLAWTVLGLGMAAVLYDAAFAALNYRFGLDARRAIASLTLFGGFASTVFWPLTLKLDTALGWRDTYFIYGLVQLLLCLPLHLMLDRHQAPRVAPAASRTRADFTLRQALHHPMFWMLALALAANQFIFSALSVHLIGILQGFGHSVTSVVIMSSLIGPMLVAGRLLEMTFGHRVGADTLGKLCFATLPAAMLLVMFLGRHQLAMALFCAVYGLATGILTIVRGTVPQLLFGTRNYGAIAGALATPSLLTKAAGPLAVAAMMGAQAGPAPLFGMLLAFSLVSLVLYLLALRGQAAAPAPVATG
ncbi:MFS transporter [Massilia sp. PAMC28688]|nr:MFS transporter [Massilia sp. PAMC28688]